MKTGIAICLGITALWGLLALIQLWVPLFSGEVFFKISLSAFVIVVIVLVTTLAIREYLDDKSMKSKGFIDE